MHFSPDNLSVCENVKEKNNIELYFTIIVFLVYFPQYKMINYDIKCLNIKHSVVFYLV